MFFLKSCVPSSLKQIDCLNHSTGGERSGIPRVFQIECATFHNVKLLDYKSLMFWRIFILNKTSKQIWNKIVTLWNRWRQRFRVTTLGSWSSSSMQIGHSSTEEDRLPEKQKQKHDSTTTLSYLNPVWASTMTFALQAFPKKLWGNCLYFNFYKNTKDTFLTN